VTVVVRELLELAGRRVVHAGRVLLRGPSGALGSGPEARSGCAKVRARRDAHCRRTRESVASLAERGLPLRNSGSSVKERAVAMNDAPKSTNAAGFKRGQEAVNSSLTVTEEGIQEG